MKTSILLAACAAAVAVSATAAPKPAAAPPKPAAPAPSGPGPADWRAPDPANVLVIDTNKGRIVV